MSRKKSIHRSRDNHVIEQRILPAAGIGGRLAASSNRRRPIEHRRNVCKSLEGVERAQLRTHAGLLWSIVVVRHGYVVFEVHAPVTLASTRFDLWSGSKSFTATAWGILLDSLARESNSADVLTLDDPIYHLIPGGDPLTDPLKAEITLRHLLCSNHHPVRVAQQRIHPCHEGRRASRHHGCRRTKKPNGRSEGDSRSPGHGSSRFCRDLRSSGCFVRCNGGYG